MGAVPKADTTHRSNARQPMSCNYNSPDMAPSHTEGTTIASNPLFCFIVDVFGAVQIGEDHLHALLKGSIYK